MLGFTDNRPGIKIKNAGFYLKKENNEEMYKLRTYSRTA